MELRRVSSMGWSGRVEYARIVCSGSAIAMAPPAWAATVLARSNRSPGRMSTRVRPDCRCGTTAASMISASWFQGTESEARNSAIPLSRAAARRTSSEVPLDL
ncbi:hypothetical protein SRABI128_05447 [Microbacterium sp. Bi128]|nr:hypothetical protein SRABI128_05447 [Microbacterium sp. Bi128]